MRFEKRKKPLFITFSESKSFRNSEYLRCHILRTKTLYICVFDLHLVLIITVIKRLANFSDSQWANQIETFSILWLFLYLIYFHLLIHVKAHMTSNEVKISKKTTNNSDLPTWEIDFLWIMKTEFCMLFSVICQLSETKSIKWQTFIQNQLVIYDYL